MVDLGRRACTLSTLLVAAMVMASAALGAERAQLDVIGYSTDGAHFAFEQFGIQDGSGFPYSEIVVIDLESDSFVGGSPFRARIDRERADLTEARDAALAAAIETLEAFEIDRPAVPVALRADGEAAQDDGLTLDFAIPKWGLDRTEEAFTLDIELFKAPSSRDCSYFEGEPMGFGLFLTADGTRELIYRDERVPASRGCVITYKLYGVYLPFQAYNIDHAMAVLSVWSHGFEGPDRRFLAVPVSTH